MSETARVGAGGRPRQLSDEERRTQIVDAAEQVFLDQGFHGATMDKVALIAGMSKKTLYKLFSTKTALFDALIDDRLRDLTLPVEEDDDPPAEALEKLLLRISAITLAPRQIQLFGLLVAETRHSKGRTQTLQKLGLGEGGGTLEKWFALQKQRGTLPIDDPDEAANMIYGLAFSDFQTFMLLKLRRPPSRAEVRLRIRKAVKIFLHGL